MATSFSDKKFDIVVFGATGFTGQFVVEEIARTEDEEGGLKWAIAGRSMTKLQNVLKQATNFTGKDLEKIPIIPADVSTPSSLNEMCRQAKVVLNCVGPYQFYGEAVVKACVENKAHHIDISGEPIYLENTQLLYHTKAKEAGVYILEACGFDSIPADMGIVYMRRQFNGDLNHVEAYLGINYGPAGGRINVGTLSSAIHGIRNRHKLKDIRKQMGTKPIPAGEFPLPKRPVVFYSKHVNSWCVPSGADRSVVSKSQRYGYDEKKQRPILFNSHLRIPHLFALFFFITIAVMFALLYKFKFGRNLLLKYPRFFSLGFFSSTGPTRQQMDGTSFTMHLVGKGHESKIEDISKQHQDKPNKDIVVRITGPEMGYVTTPICMVQAAYVLLKERPSLPPGGGVFTPGAAFAKTTLIDRLNKHSVKFEVTKA